MSTGSRVLSSFVLLLAACGDGAVGETRYGIVNGRPEGGHPSVGLLRDEGGGFCTGTLVGTRTVLSAAHCIVPDLVYTFELGGKSYPVIRARAHAGYTTEREFDQNDIGVFILGEAPPVDPTPIAGRAPSVGMEVTLVGFGVSGEEQDDGGVKRIGKNRIEWVRPKEIGWTGTAGSSTSCYGDSGGPSLAMIDGIEMQVGIVSRGTGPCGEGEIDTRVDAYRAWLMHESMGDLLVGGLPELPAEHPDPMRVTPLAPEAVEPICAGRDCPALEAAPPAASPRDRLDLGCSLAPRPTSPPGLLLVLLALALIGGRARRAALSGRSSSRRQARGQRRASP
ncbi:MAG: S1 family peptidase [Acidobacteriota bacterium]